MPKHRNVMVKQLARVHAPTPESFVRDYVNTGTPCIITGLADGWKARDWTPRSLAERFPASPLTYEIWDGDFSKNDPVEFGREQTYVDSTFREFVDLLESVREPSRKYYCAQFKLFERLPELRDEIKSLEPFMGLPTYLPRRLQRRLIVAPFFWLGPAGSLSTLHFDRADNFFVQIYGRKKWVHYAPADTQRLYSPSPHMVDGLLHFSPIDPESPDLERFPRFRDAEPFETIVEPGEVVFTPASWWHYVRGLDTSISLNFFWVAPRVVRSLRHWAYHWSRRKLLTSVGLRELALNLEVQPSSPTSSSSAHQRIQ
jgi:[protein]-arginine 3-hydroxylase / protease